MKIYHHHPQASKNTGCWESACLTSSPYATMFSDFPPVESVQDATHWHHTEYLKYLQEYDHRFGISEHIKFD
eukprot:gene22725-9159_t